MCGEVVKSVASLQVHLLSYHCAQSNTILELLKNQQQVMKAMQLNIENINQAQINVSIDLKEVKTSLLKGCGSVERGPPPPVPALPPAPPTAAPPVRQSYAATASTARQQARPRAAKPVKKISYIGDSISHNILFNEIEKITKATVSRRKAYGSRKAAGQRFPNSNFTDVVPQEMDENNPDVLVLQRDSVTLTDVPTEASIEYIKQQVMLASYTMVNVATAALDNNPDCQKVVLMQAVPRYDNKEDLNKYGNEMMNKALAESTSVKKDKVIIGVHNLDCHGGLQQLRERDDEQGPGRVHQQQEG